MICNFNWINDESATFWSGSMCLYKYRYSHDFECILGEISVSKFFKEFTSADLSQIAQEKLCDLLLIIYMQKCDCFSFLRFTACHSSLFPPTSDNLDQDWSKLWQVNVDGKNAAGRNLFMENWNLLSFCVFNSSCFPIAATERNTSAKKISLYCCVSSIWVLAEESVATVVSSMAVFVRTFMHAITAE